MSDFEVDLPALDAFADRTAGRRDQLEQVRSQLAEIHLERGTFGYIPGIGERIHEAYAEFVDGCDEATGRAVDAESSVSDAVHRVSAAYTGSDQRSAGNVESSYRGGPR